MAQTEQKAYQDVISYGLPDMHPSCQINVAAICPDTYRVVCGTDTPAASVFNFQSSEPTKSFSNVSTEITALRIHGRSSHYSLLGTYGGTIVNWDLAQNKPAGKLTGHLTSVSAITVERNANMNVLLSGAVDTNVKIWDIRQKQCINTFKGHSNEITSLDISPDSRVVVSGSKDGTVKFWDTCKQMLLKSIKMPAAGYPVCLRFNPCDFCIAIGTSNKCVKYYELENYTLVSTSTIEMMEPRALCFTPSGEECFVAYDDGTRIYRLDNETRPILLDVIQKPYRMVSDLQVSSDGSQLYCLDSNCFLGNAGGDPSAAAKMKTNQLFLQHIDVSRINFDPKVRPPPIPRPTVVPPREAVPRQPQTGMMMNSENAYGANHRKPSSQRGFDAAQAPAVRGKPPSILASNGLQLLGTTASLSANPYEKQPKLSNGGVRKDSANQRRLGIAASKSAHGDTNTSFYPTPQSNQPFELALEDFLSPAKVAVHNVKLKPALDSETETTLIESAMQEHGSMMAKLRKKKDQLEHALKYWNEAGKRTGPNSMQSTVDSLMMMSDMSSVFDLLDATFSKGYKLNDLSLAQINVVLRKAEDLQAKSKVQTHRRCAQQVTKKIISVWKDRVQMHLKQTQQSQGGEDEPLRTPQELERRQQCLQFIERVNALSNFKPAGDRPGSQGY